MDARRPASRLLVVQLLCRQYSVVAPSRLPGRLDQYTSVGSLHGPVCPSRMRESRRGVDSLPVLLGLGHSTAANVGRESGVGREKWGEGD